MTPSGRRFPACAGDVDTLRPCPLRGPPLTTTSSIPSSDVALILLPSTPSGKVMLRLKAP